jgi:hypothetical protein
MGRSISREEVGCLRARTQKKAGPSLVRSLPFPNDFRRQPRRWLWLLGFSFGRQRRGQEHGLAFTFHPSFAFQFFFQGCQQSAQISYSRPSISFWRHSLARPHKSQRIMAHSSAIRVYTCAKEAVRYFRERYRGGCNLTASKNRAARRERAHSRPEPGAGDRVTALPGRVRRAWRCRSVSATCPACNKFQKCGPSTATLRSSFY